MLSLFLTILMADLVGACIIAGVKRIEFPKKKRRTKKRLASVIPLKKID